LIARGFRNDGSGIYKFVGKQPQARVVGYEKKEFKADESRVKVRAVKIPANTPKGKLAIMNVLIAGGIHFETEVQVVPERGWRFDIAVPSMKLAIEYEGIFSEKSRHTGLK